MRSSQAGQGQGPAMRLAHPPPPPPEAGMLLRLVLAHEIRTLEGNLLHNKGRMAHFGDN